MMQVKSIVITRTKVLIPLLPIRIVVIFALFSTTLLPIFAGSIDDRESVVPMRQAYEFVGKVLSVTPDPNEGWWINLQVGDSRAMVWWGDKETLPCIGAKILMVGFYLDELVYPIVGGVTVWIGIYYEVKE